MKCPTCNTTIEPGVAFCPNCGTRIELPPNLGTPTPKHEGETDESRVVPAEGRTIALREVPLPPAEPRESAFGLPPASAPPYTPTYTPPTNVQPYTPPSYPPSQSAMPYMPPGGYAPVTPTSTAAIVSLVFGILGWTILPVISSFVAVVAGHMARREINDSQGRISGSGLATAGLILGYLMIGLVLLGLLGLCVLFGIGVAFAD